MDEATESRCPLEHPWAWTAAVVTVLAVLALLVGRGAAERRKLRDLEAEFAEISEG